MLLTSILLACLPLPLVMGARPNILLIVADDLGLNEMGFVNNSRGLITPNLDGLAQEGVILTNYYVQPICSPTRSALMTGRYPIHIGTQANVIYWDTPWAVPLNQSFISEDLKAAGYRTAMFGKWHLGMYSPQNTPMGRGFEEYVGYYQGCGSAWTHESSCCSAGSPDSDQNFICAEQHPKDFRGYDWFKGTYGSKVAAPDVAANHSNSVDLVTAAAVAFLRSMAADPAGSAPPPPFFLYLPFQNIHSPYTCEKKFRDLYSNHSVSDAERTMFGYISELDNAVGYVVHAMTEAQRNNTVIVFTSDNGAPPAGDEVDHPYGPGGEWIVRNFPSRGWKTQIWEGGTRVAGFVSSPMLPSAVKGTKSDQLYHITDWHPTFAALARYGTVSRLHPRDANNTSSKLDGYNIWNSIVSKETPSPRTVLLYNINPLCKSGQAGPPKAGLRQGDFKLLAWCYQVKGIDGAKRTGPVPGPGEFSKGYVLYNLTADPAETTNVAGQNPRIVAQLLQRLEEFASTMVEPMVWDPPFQGRDYFCRDCPKHSASAGVAVPWESWCKDPFCADLV